MTEKQLIVCVNRRLTLRNPSCAARDSEQLADAIERRCQGLGLPIRVERFLCLGNCENGPNMRLAPAGRFFEHVSEQDVPFIMQEIQRFLAIDDA